MPDIQPQIDPAQGFCIEVSCLPDGTFNVSVEPLEEEAKEPSEDPGHEAASIDEALAAAMEIYRQVSGGGPDEESPEEDAAEPQEEPADNGQSFEQGFKGVRGQGLGM